MNSPCNYIATFLTIINVFDGWFVLVQLASPKRPESCGRSARCWGGWVGVLLLLVLIGLSIWLGGKGGDVSVMTGLVINAYLVSKPLSAFFSFPFSFSALWIQVVFWPLWEWLQGKRLWGLQGRRLQGTWQWQWLQRKRLQGGRAPRDAWWREGAWHLLQLLHTLWRHPKLPTGRRWDELRWENVLQ